MYDPKERGTHDSSTRSEVFSGLLRHCSQNHNHLAAAVSRNKAGAVRWRRCAIVVGSWVHSPMLVEAEKKVATAAYVSARIIAAGIIIAFLYFAASVIVTLLVAVLLAYFLDPVVARLEDFGLARGLGSFLVVLLSVVLLFLAGWIVVERIDQFGADWPKYRKPLHEILSAAEMRLDRIESQAGSIGEDEKGRQVLVVTEPHPVRRAILTRVGSLSSALIGVTFVPFLVFFMLAGKRHAWHSTMQLFDPTNRTQVKETLEEVGSVLHGFLSGTALVGAILVISSWLFFWAIGLDFPFLAGLVSGLSSLVPYFGVLLACVPPLLIGLKDFHSVAAFVGIFSMITFLHLVAANVLTPALIGRRVHVNALAATISLLFWGWLWGGMGLLLAVPITATIKVVCDHVEPWSPVGRWLGS
jgi:predicted PurR-regulated permease PerM